MDRSLVRTIQAEEYRRRLGRSIWLYLVLEGLRHKDGLVAGGRSITAGELGTVLGVGPRQVRRDLERLREADLVSLRNTGRGFQVSLHPLGALQ